MLKILICEDETEILNLYKLIIDQIIVKNNFNAFVSLATNSPQKIINYSNKQSNIKNNEPNLYILDIEFSNSTTKGIDLAEYINSRDTNSYIIFITSHSELYPLTLKYKIKNLDFIKKDDGINYIRYTFEKDIKVLLYQKNTLNDFKYYIGSNNNSININEISFFISIEHTNKIEIHYDHGISQLSSSISKIKKRLPNFLSINNKILVNPNKIKKVDPNNNYIVLYNKQIFNISHKLAKWLNERINKVSYKIS